MENLIEEELNYLTKRINQYIKLKNSTPDLGLSKTYLYIARKYNNVRIELSSYLQDDEMLNNLEEEEEDTNNNKEQEHVKEK
jgi:hypothetical protein